MRVLITGATGFLGSQLARQLAYSGFEIVALIRNGSSLDRLSDLIEHIEFHTISDQGIVNALGGMNKCHAIIHTATCYGRNDETWSTLNEANVSFPLSLLEKSIACGVEIFLNIDTVLDWNVSPYALSKRHFVNWGRNASLDRSSLHFINARLEQFYGPGDSREKFVTWLIHQCLADKIRIPLTHGMQRRDIIHVDDVVSGLLKLLQACQTGKVPTGYSEFDIGSGNSVTIRSFAEMVHRLCGSNATLDFGALPYRKNECMESMSNTRPINALGWKAEINLEEGLINTISIDRCSKTK